MGTPLRSDPCAGCPLYSTGQLCPEMPISGENRLGITFVGEAQGYQEAQAGVQFVGEAGQTLRSALASLGYDLDLDFSRDNAVRCFVSPKVSVYTSKGYKQLYQIKVGDLVLTHKGRFRKVVSLIHDLPLEQRRNRELLVRIKTRFKEYTVTSSHLFLKEGAWIKAQNLNIGDSLIVLGEKCKECGKIYYKNPEVFDEAESTCSPNCHNLSINRKVDTQKISASMVKQYETGIRDRFKITKEANKKTRILAQMGELSLQNLTSQQREISRINLAKSKQRYNELLENNPTIGKGEEDLAYWLTENNIDFYHQFAIGNLNIDFYLPQYNLLVEVENPESYKCNKKIKDENYRNRERVAERENKNLIFISSKNPRQQLCRMLKNHNNQYYFTKTEILDIEIYTQKRQEYLYSLEVEEDYSFIVGGIVHHNCRPPRNRKPTHKEIKCCKPKIFEDIHKRKPKMVIALGTSALVSLIGEYTKNIKITRFRDTIIPIPEHNFYLASTIHPSFVNRQKAPDDDYAYDTLKRDLKAALNYAHTLPDNHQVEILDLKKPLRLVTDFLTFSALMEKLDREKPVTAFDFETSSLKPQGSQHRIWSMSICFGGVSYSFPVQYPRVQGKFPQRTEDTFWGAKYFPLVYKKIQRYLQDPKIYKIAHNESFERIWSYYVFKTLVANLGWCSMVNQHILDSRAAFCGLKLQAFVRWGVHGYDDEANKYMGSDDARGGNSLNQLYHMPLESLLTYGGIDSFLTEKLAYEEKEVFKFGNNKPLNRARKLFHDTGIAFTDCQKTGVRIDVDYYTDKSHDLAGEVQFIRDKIYESAPIKKFEIQEKRPFKLTSPKDLRILLFNILNEIPVKQTETGLDSVDKSVLADLKTPLAKQVVKIRELIKLKDTYIAQYLREEVDGVMYPFLHTHTARSGRSCIAKGTLILVARDFEKHPNGIPIEDVRKGDLIYCFNDKLNPAVRKVRWAGKTGHREVVRLHFHWYTKERGYLDITPEHKVRLINGEYIPACLLTKDYRSSIDSKKAAKVRTLSCIRTEDKLNFTGHLCNGKGILEHRFLYKNLIGSLSDTEIVHHKDETHLNHTPTNLEKMLPGDHARLHNANRPISKETRLKCSINAKAAWASGACDHIPEIISLCLSRFKVLRALAEAKGRPVLCSYDFNTFKKYCKLHDINIGAVRARYDRNNKYISKNKLMAAMNAGPNYLLKTFGFNYYKIKKIYSYYNRIPKRVWRNQFGEGLVGNHVITKVEWLNQSTDVYDIEVEDFSNFFANGICVHNSSSGPNLQNTPIRDEKAKKLIRSGILPFLGHKLAEIDFKGIEINVLGCETKDRALLKYLWNPKSDMHYDQAKELFFLNDSQMNKDFRYYAKSDFVFLEVYGGEAAASAKYLWHDATDIRLGPNSDGPKLLKHFFEQGIRNLDDYIEHVKEVESRLWKRFPGIRTWQKKQCQFYLDYGYIETHFGFRRSGFLSRNAILNTQTQSTAAHLLWWCFKRLNEIRKKEKWESKLLGQIHDSKLPSIHPDEEEHVMKTICRMMTIDAPRTFKWIIVPIDIEIEMGEIDQSWYDIKEVSEEYYKSLRDEKEAAVLTDILKARVRAL